MEKNIKIIIRKLNAIGNQIGYPYYFYPDGTYGKENINAIVSIKGPLGQVKLKEAAPTYASVAELYTKALEKANVLDYLYSDGTISPKRLNLEITGVIGWKNPDKDAPIGKRALCFTFNGWKYDDFMSNNDFSQNNQFSPHNINSPQGIKNSQLLQDLSEQNLVNILAVNHCLEYTGAGLQANDCFLPSIEEVKLTEPVFLDLVGKIENLSYGTSDKVRSKRFGTNSSLLKNFIFTSNFVAPNSIMCYLYYPGQDKGKFYAKDLNDCACIAPAFWM